MNTRRDFLRFATSLAAAPPFSRAASDGGGLDPRGRIHIPIGIANSLDTLKTFVEAEGCFSPGFGSYGVYFWVFDPAAQRLFAPTMEQADCSHGFDPPGYLIPWSGWEAGGIEVRTEVCQVARGQGFVVAARARLKNPGPVPRPLTLIVALRALGPAGWPVQRLDISPERDALLADGHVALVSRVRADSAGVSEADDVGSFARVGQAPGSAGARSQSGDCSGSLCFPLELRPGEERSLGFVCPVLPGRRAARHHWIDIRQNAMVDGAELNPAADGVPQPDPGLAECRALDPGRLFEQARAYWKGLVGGIDVRLPDARWGEALRAILGHAALCMNEGAPDVAVVNYNVFNRDGMYVANMLQKSGLFHLSAAALDYFLAHPFNGRAYPEADNPGQVLWSLWQQWLFARDRRWLARVYPAAARLAAMIEYYRTQPGPHWVNASSLDFGDALRPEQRQELKPGRCDGHHPEYTEAFDIAGLRGAVELAEAAGRAGEAARWKALAADLMRRYDETYGANLRARSYGNYCVLWPCALYPYSAGRGREQFQNVGAQRPGDWRYFPLATAHQGLLAGNREAGYGTLQAHLQHRYMQGWYAFDELDDGPGSGAGSWHKVRSRWPHQPGKPGENTSVAMPHGWAIAEVWLLLRDSLLFEQDGSLILFGGVPPEWFRDPKGMHLSGLRTQFGALTVDYRVQTDHGILTLDGEASPPRGFVLRNPPGRASVRGRMVRPLPNGDVPLPAGTREVRLDAAPE